MKFHSLFVQRCKLIHLLKIIKCATGSKMFIYTNSADEMNFYTEHFRMLNMQLLQMPHTACGITLIY